jgi:glycosyltransferase involved in cell wall biosynthesis
MLYVGRIAPEKGLEVLLDAMRRLRSEWGSGPRLTIVGSDFHGSPYGPTFARNIEKSELNGAVRILGHVPYGEELFRQYDAHDLVVLPSFTEGFPQVILEAMARGVPVVSTHVGGIPRVIRDGENGLLVPPRDPAALAGAIARLVADPSLADRLVREGQKSVRAYTRRAQVDGIFAFLSACYPSIPFTRSV